MPPPPKRRRTEPTAVEEVTFDPAARQEYLTGFHKRKLQRAKHAQEIAEKRARAERIEARRKLREQRKAELERHVQEVNALLRPISPDSGAEDAGTDSDDEWAGLSDPEPEPIDHEAEYIDEDKYTTVTVESMDISREGIFKAHDGQAGQEDTKQAAVETEIPNPTKKKRIWTKEKPKDQVDKSTKKKRSFRYESKAERKATRTKQRSKNHKQARERRAG